MSNEDIQTSGGGVHSNNEYQFSNDFTSLSFIDFDFPEVPFFFFFNSRQRVSE